MSKDEEILTKFARYAKFHKEDGQLVMKMNLNCKMKLDEAIRGVINENKALREKIKYVSSTRDCDEEFEL